METLLIHHNNTAYISESFFEKDYLFQASSTKDVDSYITEEFINEGLLVDLNEAELVFIKVSLSDNYLEYLGIRLAYHLRLDNRVTNKRFAIVFLGEESLSFLCKTYEGYPILLAEGVYKIRDNKEEITLFLEKGSYQHFIEKENFAKFLDKIWLRPPANFETNHSIANEWGICRLSDAIKTDSNENYKKLKDSVSNLTFKNSLYFKYAEAKIDSREGFNSKNKIPINNLGFDDLKVALIDDEHLKGWYSIYQLMLDKSKATSFPFNEFSREHDKLSLIKNIKEWIEFEAIAKYDCNTFILDLRLHEEDFNKLSNDKEELSGISIYKFIKSLNPGYQIVFVTASNKIWNLGQLEGFDTRNYIVKENPEFSLTRVNTKIFFTQFQNSLTRCKENLSLIEAYDIKKRIRQKCFLTSFVRNADFLNLASNRNGLLDKIYICLERGISDQFDLNQALLYCFHFLEKYCSLNEVIESDRKNYIDVKNYNGEITKVVKSSGDLLKINRGRFSFQNNLAPHIISIDKLETRGVGSLHQPVNSATLYSAVLYFRENCDKSQVDRVLELLFVRNNLSAHHTGDIKSGYVLNPDDIMFMLRLFDKIQF